MKVGEVIRPSSAYLTIFSVTASSAGAEPTAAAAMRAVERIRTGRISRILRKHRPLVRLSKNSVAALTDVKARFIAWKTRALNV